MPIAFDPESTAEFSLKADEARRVVFRTKMLTCRQALRVRQLRDEAKACATDADVYAKFCEMLRIGIVGWTVGGKFTPNEGDAILDVVSEDGFISLIGEWLAVAKGLGDDDAGKSDSPSRSATEACPASAATAAPVA